MTPLRCFEDRGMAIPAGKIVKTALVPVDECVLANRSRMAVGDVDAAYRRRLALGSSQPWPPIVGEWVCVGTGYRFNVLDGRHDYVAALMLGYTHVLVAWEADA